MRRRLEKFYEAIETSDLTLEVPPRIFTLRHREKQLESARDDAERQLEQRRMEFPTTDVIREYVADFREFLKEGTIPNGRHSSATSLRASRWSETKLRLGILSPCPATA